MSDRAVFAEPPVEASNRGISPVAARPVALAWRSHVLVEIANFISLRRHVGKARAAGLSRDVAARVAAAYPDVRLHPASASLLEIDFEGDTAEDLAVCLAAIRALCDAPFDLDGEQHRIELIFAAAVCAAERADEVRLTEEAEAALAEARAGNRAVTHDLVQPGRREVQRLGRELDLAIARNELLIQYQPKVHVRRQEIGSAEALIRWRHPTRGLVLPGDFIPAAEQAHLIDRLTLWTIRQVIADHQRLADRGHDLRLFINISGQLLSDEAFVREACALVGESDAKLGFEITETSVIRDPVGAIANLQIFADSGVVIAIDDYGAGLSSLAYLKQLPARELKIDKLFVTQLTSSNRDPLIVRSTIDLAHALEMEVVAEGVESHAAMALLTVMGCDMVQGFLISRPITLEALETFLSDQRARPAVADARPGLRALATAWARR
jgi:EAL domain-containing protein (putative c-di-GMP-specific phosphodiesterase class I)